MGSVLTGRKIHLNFRYTFSNIFLMTIVQNSFTWNRPGIRAKSLYASRPTWSVYCAETLYQYSGIVQHVTISRARIRVMRTPAPTPIQAYGGTRLAVNDECCGCSLILSSRFASATHRPKSQHFILHQVRGPYVAVNRSRFFGLVR